MGMDTYQEVGEDTWERVTNYKQECDFCGGKGYNKHGVRAYRGELSAFICDACIDKIQIWRDATIRFDQYDGPKWGPEKQREEAK